MLWALNLYSSNRCDNRGGVYEPYMGLTTYVELTLPQLGCAGERLNSTQVVKVQKPDLFKLL